MKPGDVVTLAVRQADGQRKLRPAVLVKRVPPFDDWMVAPLSTQLRHVVQGVDMLIPSSHADYGSMGLRSESIIRVTQLQLVEGREIGGTIGLMRPQTFRQLLKQFSDWLLAE